MEVGCGGCIGCRRDRTLSWAIRCVHEAQLHEDNCFITLTYDQDHLPADGSLQKHHYQQFMKEIRRAYAPKTIRFFMCGEYGDKNMRPHYHACLFGHDFQDKELWKMSNGQPLYRSSQLEKYWRRGFSTIGSVSWQSAAYVARYIFKKLNGPFGTERYERTDPSSGEIYEIDREYVTMSRRPGIGAEWIKKYHRDVYPGDFVVHDGKQYKPPRFYDKWLSVSNPDLHEQILHSRHLFAQEHLANGTDERLDVREQCAEAKLALLPRHLEAEHDPPDLQRLRREG